MSNTSTDHRPPTNGGRANDHPPEGGRAPERPAPNTPTADGTATTALTRRTPPAPPDPPAGSALALTEPNPLMATRVEDLPLLHQAEYYRTRIDPTRGQRIVKAMELLEPFTYDSKNEHNHYRYASAAKVYGIVQNVLAKAGLHVRKKLFSIDVVEVDLPAARSRQSSTKSALTVRLDAAFAFAAPDDGPDAVLAWERRVYWGPVRDIQSEQAIWTYYQRYWLTDALLLSSFDPSLEIDARGDTGVDPEGVQRIESGRRARQRAERGYDDQPPPPPSEHSEQSIDYDAIIERGREKNEMTHDQLTEVFLECGNDKRKVITALSARYKETLARQQAEANAARALAGEEHPPPAREQPAPKAEAAGGDRGAARAPGDRTGAAAPAAAAQARAGEPAPSATPLTGDEIRPVYEKIVAGDISPDTMRRIVRDYLKAPQLKNVTVEQITAAKNAAKLQLPPGTGVADTLWAVIRDASLKIEDEQNGAAGAADGDTAAEPQGAAAREPAPGTDTSGSAETSTATGTAATAPQDAGEPPPTLTVEEQIEYTIRKHGIAEKDITTLRAMARGNSRKLLTLLQNVVDSNE